ncbi:MAG: Ger(x)C family spore germination protein [Oscillospiraceae bacterium]|jgi:spore germination protein KC|nr:Ger(x)C family spore germination protein [Oscillospiraceae bacterium]
MRRGAAAAILLAAALTLSGCGTSMELKELAIVMGLGVDAAENGEYRVTAQIARPALAKEDGGDGGEAYFNVTETGMAVFSALRELMNMFSRKMYTQQCDVLIIGEEAARRGVSDLLEYFLRNVESRMTMPLMIARGTALEVFEQTTYLEPMPAIQLSKMAHNQRYTGLTTSMTVFEFLCDLTSESLQPTAPIVELFTDDAGMTKARIAGTAIFKEGRMVGEFDSQEVYGLLLVNNQLHSGVMQITGLDGLIELEIMRCESRVTPVVEGDTVSMRIDISVECNLVSTTSRVNINRVEKEREMERLAREEILSRVRSALEAAMALDSDVFGFGQRIYRRYPALYGRIEAGDGGWDGVFRTMRVETSANVSVSSDDATLWPVADGGGE